MDRPCPDDTMAVQRRETTLVPAKNQCQEREREKTERESVSLRFFFSFFSKCRMWEYDNAICWEDAT